MNITFSQPMDLPAALEILRQKQALPTNLSTAELREMADEIRQLALYSARTTSLHYLDQVKAILADFASGKINAADARTQCKQWLEKLGYTPEQHFGAAADKTIPPAAAGSLQDLASEPRLNLMLDTNIRLLFNGRFMRAGLDPVRARLFPAWEFVRVYEREHERNETALSWPRRWVMAGGALHDGRMIALKTDNVWNELGSSALFADGTDANTPPYWWNSGGGLREVNKADCVKLGLIVPAQPVQKVDRSLLGKFFQDPAKATLANLNATRADLQAAIARLAA